MAKLDQTARKEALTLRRELYNEGLTDNQIALRLGMSQQTIKSWRNAHGLPSLFKQVATRQE